LLGDLLIGWLVFNANLGDNKIAIKEWIDNFILYIFSIFVPICHILLNEIKNTQSINTISIGSQTQNDKKQNKNTGQKTEKMNTTLSYAMSIFINISILVRYWFW
jgi:hypothetical protein